MTIYLSENIHLTKKEYENILDLYFGKKSYVLVFSKEEQCYLLFTHGSKTGYILIDNNYITLAELGKMLESLSYNICIKIICCYGAYQTPYETCNVSVKPYINNKYVMNFKPFEQNDEKYCNIHCSM